MNVTVTTTAKLPKSIHQKLLEKVITDGYGMRGKNKWMLEAIENFLALNDYPELVDIANDIEEKSDVISMRLPEELMDRLEKAVIKIRGEYPAMEGVKSNIIRASLIQRLLRGTTSVTEVKAK